MTEPLGKRQRRQAGLDRRHLADAAQEVQALLEARDESEDVPQALRRLRQRQSAVERCAERVGTGLRLAEVDLHRRAAVLRRLRHAAGRRRRCSRRARARHLRRLGHHRPHQSRPARSRTPRPPANTCWRNGVAKADFNSYGARRGNHEVMMRGTFANVRIKNLMIPPNADGTRVEGGITLVPAERRADVDLRRGDEIHRAGHADRRVRRRGIRHRLLARLGGQGHAAARREGRDRAQLRAHPPLAIWSAWACCRCSSRAATRADSLGIKGDEAVRHRRPRRRHQAAAGRHAGRSIARTATRRK